MISQETRDKWSKRLEFCKHHQSKLNDWQLGFIDSMDSLISAGKDLTINQSFKLGEIYNKLVND